MRVPRRTLGVLLALATVGISDASAAARPLQPAPHAARRGPVSVDLTWLAVSPVQPTRLYVGLDLGYRSAGVASSDQAIASSDGGATFDYVDVRDSTPDATPCQPLRYAPDGRGYIFFTPNGRDVYTECGGTLRDAVTLVSPDGVRWRQAAYDALEISPLDARRWYDAQSDWQSIDQGGGCFSTVRVSDDGGAHWRVAAAMPQVAPLANHTGGDDDRAGDYVVGGLVADPAHANTVYANYSPCPLADPDTDIALVARSQDGGARWTVLPVPPGLKNFWVYTDPHEPGLLVGATSDTGVPADRRYLSGDQGRSWRVAACPGDLHGTCPRAVVDQVFGAGRSYAFFKSGVYAFTGGGPAGARLALSDRLPVPAASIVDAQAGSRPGDPVYLLSNRANGPVHGSLYRSADGGATWHLLPAGVLPTVAPPSTAPGALLVSATHHSVAAPFVAAYRRLGPYLLGRPLTEAYRQDGVLSQVFDHLRLELRGGRVVVGALGRDLSTPAPPQRAVPSSATRRYFARTGQVVSGDLLAYWQTHGGEALFGAPISGVVRQPNGDGSGRSYSMQWFENACLEIHPEIKDPRFHVLLRLLGREYLAKRGWA